MPKAKESKKEKIKKYWDEQASVFKESDLATAPDTYYRRLEIDRISECLRDGKSALDIGCGNGYSTIKFAERNPNINIIGLDYSEQMIKYAKKYLAKKKPGIKNRIDFIVGDVLNLSNLVGRKFDFVVSERCLINLENWAQQKKALLEIKKVLKQNGRIILCENVREGLARLNKLRHSLALQPIKIRWHNYYMPEKQLFDFAARNFAVIKTENIGSLYYIISRVVYAKLCALENKEPDYMHPINKIASKLPSSGDYSPNYIIILKNK